MSNDLDVRKCVKIILSRKKLIILWTAIFLVLSAGVALILPRVYEASLIMEIGKIYLGKMSIQEKQFLEEPDSVSEFISSEGVLEQVRKELNLDISLEAMKKKLEVETFSAESKYLPVIKVNYQGGDPRQVAETVTALASVVVNRQSKKYRLYQKSLDKRISAIGNKIKSLENISAAQSRYRELSQGYIARGETSVDEFNKELGELNTLSPRAIDLLYLQGSALTEKQHITELTAFQANMDLKIGINQKEIADAEMEIIDLGSMKDLSSPTEIISPAVIPEKSVKPSRMLVVLIGGVLGFSLCCFVILSREALKD
jgi:uncharacterized protein involved in exopolysaccharide biosynthesis